LLLWRPFALLQQDKFKLFFCQIRQKFLLIFTYNLNEHPFFGDVIPEYVAGNATTFHEQDSFPLAALEKSVEELDDTYKVLSVGTTKSCVVVLRALSLSLNTKNKNN